MDPLEVEFEPGDLVSGLPDLDWSPGLVLAVRPQKYQGMFRIHVFIVWSEQEVASTKWIDPQFLKLAVRL